MKRHSFISIAVALLWVVAAEAQEPRWTFRVLGFASDFSRTDEDDRGGIFRVKLEGRAGAGASVEVRRGRRLGVELAALWSQLDERTIQESLPFFPPQRSVERRSINLRILTVGFPIHLTPGQHLDLSVGPIAGTARYGTTPRTSAQNYPTYGLGLGVDWPLGDRRWALSGTARFLETDDELLGLFEQRWLMMKFYGVGISYRH